MFLIKNFSILLIIIGLTSLVGCSMNQSFEDYFHNEMEENKKDYEEEVNYSYSLVHQEQNVVNPGDAIAIFTENNRNGEQIFIAYFEQENGTWYWQQTRGAEWDTPVKWSSMNKVPYIYSGAISDGPIKEIYVGREQAKIIDVEDDKRFWYAISKRKDVDVKFIKENGNEEIIEEIDEEMLKEWKDGKNK